MIIATEQTMKIAFSQPTLTVKTKLSDSISGMTLELENAAQYKPTVIRMPFEKMNEGKFKAFMRSFEAGDTYQILIKGKIRIKSLCH